MQSGIIYYNNRNGIKQDNRTCGELLDSITHKHVCQILECKFDTAIR